MSKDKKIKCKWYLSTPCDGEIKDTEMFNNKIIIPICARHLHEHKVIVFLEQQGLNIDEVVSQTDIWREQKAKELEQTTGLKVEDAKP